MTLYCIIFQSHFVFSFRHRYEGNSHTMHGKWHSSEYLRVVTPLLGGVHFNNVVTRSFPSPY